MQYRKPSAKWLLTFTEISRNNRKLQYLNCNFDILSKCNAIGFSSFKKKKTKKKLLWLSKGSSSTCLSYRLFSSPSASLSHEVGDLQPHTEYAFRLVASNGVGSAHSAWIVFMTAEDSKWSEQCTAKCPLHRGISGVFTFFPNKEMSFPCFLDT